MVTETRSAQPDRKVPFTVIGGFLGAGKTSLVNHLLASAEQRYAVLVNDFGALNIDAGLIREHQGDTIALANGCICCSLAAGFSKGLGQVLDNLQSFDHIIVEASGIADPGRIQDIARIEPRLETRGNPVMLDARQLLQQAQDPHIGSLIHQQIAAADLLIVNKHNLLTATDSRALTHFLEQLSDASLLYTDWGRVDPADLLALPARPRKFRPLLAEATNHGLYSEILTAEMPLQYDRFHTWAEGLSADILRGKGLVHFTDKPGTWLWQKVGDQVRLTDYSYEDSVTGCELLLISKRKESLPTCF
ncbi:CobW family GTP-binding protein [Aliamphritea hakodatensis]|uniref:CobW family GTP-binding protein n=1 Tax=Aliamphritea hakodatensis TaxID=2895352 RepID=UPI0022FD87B7|nr:CobW family GTP-binding protein [Aliamphritea hakodatensis]